MRRDWRLGVVLAREKATRPHRHARTRQQKPMTGALPGGGHALGPTAGGGGLARGPVPSDVLHLGDVIMVSGAGKALALEQIPNIQGALISIDPRTGRVLAMVGGWSHDISALQPRDAGAAQPGSSVKPLVYLTALEQGVQPDAPVLDGPFVQQMPDGTVYRPGNYEDISRARCRCSMRWNNRLTSPPCIWPARSGSTISPIPSRAFGIIDPMPPYYPSAIGAIDTTLWKMATAYAALDEYGRPGAAHASSTA